jgi:hypothetical protein
MGCGRRNAVPLSPASDLVWASYEGGGVTLGHLIATVAPDGALDRRYRHRSPTRALMTGICRSRLAILPDGRYRLHEEWQWTSGDKRRGISIVEEIERAHAEAVADDCRGPAIRPEQ